MTLRNRTGNIHTARGGRMHPHAVPSTARVLKPHSPRRPEVQEEIYYGVRDRKGHIRGNGYYNPAGSTK